MFEKYKGDVDNSASKLTVLRSAVRKHGSSGNGRIGLFGILVGWVHEQSYIPQVRAKS